MRVRVLGCVALAGVALLLALGAPPARADELRFSITIGRPCVPPWHYSHVGFPYVRPRPLLTYAPLYGGYAVHETHIYGPCGDYHQRVVVPLPGYTYGPFYPRYTWGPTVHYVPRPRTTITRSGAYYNARYGVVVDTIRHGYNASRKSAAGSRVYYNPRKF